jgi:hypothetical protein
MHIYVTNTHVSIHIWLGFQWSFTRQNSSVRLHFS